MLSKILSVLALTLIFAGYAQANVIPVGQIVYPNVVIASGETVSNTITTGGMSLVGCQFPAAFTGSTMTFTAATTASGTYQPIYNSAGQLSYNIAQGHFVAIDPKDFAGVQFFKIVAGSTQGATRTLNCSMKGI